MTCDLYSLTQIDKESDIIVVVLFIVMESVGLIPDLVSFVSSQSCYENTSSASDLKFSMIDFVHSFSILQDSSTGCCYICKSYVLLLSNWTGVIIYSK